MQGKIFLSGGSKTYTELDNLFLSSLDKSKPLLYIPIAMHSKKHTFEKCYEWISSIFKDLRIQMVTELKKIEKLNLKKFSGVYIGGGNTFTLLNDFKKINFLEKLSDFYFSGGIIYGGSAGAVIMGKSIVTAELFDKNTVKLTDLNALNLCSDYSIWPHYKKEHDEVIKSYKLPIIALPDNTGVIISGNTMKKTKGRIFLFKG